MPTEGWSFTPQRVLARHTTRILLMLGIGAALLAALLAVNLPPAIAQGPITAGCYAVGDENVVNGAGNQDDVLVSLDPGTSVFDIIGATGTQGIEAIAFGPTRNLYAANLNNLVTLNLATGAFAIVGAIGSGSGSASPNPILLNNVDGMTYSLEQGLFYATHRREGAPTDLLFAIDPATGALDQDHFGAGVDYVEVPAVPDPTNPGLSLTDVDDLTFDPLHDQLLAAMNSGGTGGVLVRLNPENGVPTFLNEFRYAASSPLAGTVIDDIEGLAYGNDGQLYGSTGTNGPPGAPGASDLNQLFAIDDTTGLGVSVGSLRPDTFNGPRDFEALDCLSAQVFIELRKYTNGPGQAPDDADLPTGPTIEQGDPVTWTYVFTNTGFITLTNLLLTDDQLGPIGPVGASNCPPAGTILPPGGSFTCTANGVAQLGQYANTAVVTGTSVVLPGVPAVTVTDTNPSHYFGTPFQGPITPAIALTKYTNGPGQLPQDANLPTGPNIQQGNTVTWTYIFTNTGQVALNNVTLTDDIIGQVGPGGAFNCPPANTTLAPGQSLTCTATGSAQLGQYANVGTVAGTSTVEPFQVVTDTDPSHYFGVPPQGPGIAIRKYTNGFDANGPNGSDAPAIDPPGVGAATGDITWTYQVTNTGNISFPLADVVVTDNRVTGTLPSIVDQGNGNGFLEPGEVWLFQLLGTAEPLPAVPDPLPNPDPGPPPGFERGCTQWGAGQPRSVYVNIGTVVISNTGLTASDPSRYCNLTPTADAGGQEPANPRANAVYLPLIGQ